MNKTRNNTAFHNQKKKNCYNCCFFQENLRQYVDRIFTVITKSGVSCPTVMCDIFFSLRESAAKRFQGEFQYIILLYISDRCSVGAV